MGKRLYKAAVTRVIFIVRASVTKVVLYLVLMLLTNLKKWLFQTSLKCGIMAAHLIFITPTEESGTEIQQVDYLQTR